MPIGRLLNELRSTFVLHAVASHFSNGLIPVAALFLALALLTSDPYFEHTVLHLLLVSFCAIPVSFVSGIRDWRAKFHGARAPIFRKKIGLSIVLFLLCGLSLALRLGRPDLLAEQGALSLLYAGSLVLMLPLVVMLGHLGGKLVFQTRNNQ